MYLKNYEIIFMVRKRKAGQLTFTEKRALLKQETKRKRIEAENKKYYVYDFKKEPLGMFTKTELETKFKIKWFTIKIYYLDKSKRINGLYYLKSKSF